MTPYLDLARALIPVAKAAGLIELKYHNVGTEVMGKLDGSPVTLADQEAEALITKALQELAPNIPVVGEEAVAAGYIPDISSGEFFLVDPLDGTRAFVEGSADFTVNIALLQKFIPVMGLIYVPVSGELYIGAGDEAYSIAPDGTEKRLSVGKMPEKDVTVITSRQRNGSEERTKISEYLKDYQVKEILRRSSSVKFCALVTGEADLFPCLGPTSEWDTAAGEAILNAAGGRVTTVDGKPLIYGKAEMKFLNPSFIARAA